MSKFKGRNAIVAPEQPSGIIAAELDFNDATAIFHVCGLQKGQMVKRCWAEVVTTFNGTSPAAVVGRYTNGVADDDDAFFTNAGLALGTAGIKDANGANATGFTATVDNVSVAVSFTAATGSPTQGRVRIFVEVVNLGGLEMTI